MRHPSGVDGIERAGVCRCAERAPLAHARQPWAFSNNSLAAGAVLVALAACSRAVEGRTAADGGVWNDGLDGYAAMEPAAFVRAIEARLTGFDRRFADFRGRLARTADPVGVEIEAAVAALPPLREAIAAELERFAKAGETATSEQRRELVESYRRLERVLRDAVAKG